MTWSWSPGWMLYGVSALAMEGASAHRASESAARRRANIEDLNSTSKIPATAITGQHSKRPANTHFLPRAFASRQPEHPAASKQSRGGASPDRPPIAIPSVDAVLL